jgi:hypothetical protein
MQNYAANITIIMRHFEAKAREMTARRELSD